MDGQSELQKDKIDNVFLYSASNMAACGSLSYVKHIVTYIFIHFCAFFFFFDVNLKNAHVIQLVYNYTAVLYLKALTTWVYI